MLRVLARAVEERRLTIAPDKVVSVAEVLDPLDEEKIASAFGKRVHQVYQCTEGFLGVTCAEGTLHINEDLVVVEKEYLDDRRFVPIVTDFTRTTQPIIRYRLNDVLTERREPCPCGSPFLAIERIEGRCDDVLYVRTREAGELKPVFADFVTRAIIGASGAIHEYVVRQHAPDAIEVALAVGERERTSVESAVRTSLHALFDRVDCARPSIAFTTNLEEPGVRKLRRVQRTFAVEERA
jgi:putative adenylate-forming enzyme